MPEGQFIGRKSKFIYTSDTNVDYKITLDRTLGTIANTGLTEDAAGTAVAPPPPKRFKPRVLYWQGVLDGRIVRKALVVNRAALYNAPGSQEITIDGVVGRTTGRRGEALTF